jgi:RHH-type proline utilization regulon transcriptional repressor/proline dehydrogenase/delta 1-pyrroline-5-carboxylate dehydrogenase
VQLLGRQFVLGQTMPEAMQEADAARTGHASLTYSYDMLGEGARTDADALRYLDSYTQAIAFIASHSDGARAPQRNDGISIKLSALHPRYEDAHSQRVMAELVPRVWSLCEMAARANLNLTIDAEEVDRLELSLEVFTALIQRVAQHYPQWSGFGLALQSYQTRSLELIEHLTALARQHHVRLMCRLVPGAGSAGLPGVHPQAPYRCLVPGLRPPPAGCAGCHLPAVRHPQCGHDCRDFANGGAQRRRL